MAQSFRHVLRGMSPAEVEAFAVTHRKRWWQGRHLMIKVQDGRIKAARPASRTSQPPVLKGTLRPSARGTLVEGTLHRGASAAFDYVMLFVAVLAVAVAVTSLVGDGPAGLSVGAVATAVLFLFLFLGLRVLHDAVQGAEANELRGALDEFFGTRP